MRAALAAVVLAVAGTSLSACTEVEEEESAGYEPSKLATVAGKKRVTFTAEGAARVGLRTAPIRAARGGRVVPYEALVYEADGSTYVYVATAPLSFHRERIAVERIDGDRVLASAGPAPGTRVVTTGAAEVYGTELEIAAG